MRISKAARTGAVLKSEMGVHYDYQFDKAFDGNSTQQDIYEMTTEPLIKEVLNGKNCTVFAYGATGAGKTYTMMGNDEDPGIIFRAMEGIFEGIKVIEEQDANQENCLNESQDSIETCEWIVKLSYLEVYNETIYDLLTDDQKALIPCEDSTDLRVKVLGLTEVPVKSKDQILRLLSEGNKRRRMESTAANQVSSRSHAVMQISVNKTKELRIPQGNRRSLRLLVEERRTTVQSSTLSLIDLAGSERAASTQNRGSRLREGANINKSLLALANCINALSQSGSSIPQRVKYRDSKLTHLLKPSLEGNCRVCMIAAINPSHKSYEESHNTLKYANRAKQIKLSVTANIRATSTIVSSPNELESLTINTDDKGGAEKRQVSDEKGHKDEDFSTVNERWSLGSMNDTFSLGGDSKLEGCNMEEIVDDTCNFSFEAPCQDSDDQRKVSPGQDHAMFSIWEDLIKSLEQKNLELQKTNKALNEKIVEKDEIISKQAQLIKLYESWGSTKRYDLRSGLREIPIAESRENFDALSQKKVRLGEGNLKKIIDEDKPRKRRQTFIPKPTSLVGRKSVFIESPTKNDIRGKHRRVSLLPEKSIAPISIVNARASSRASLRRPR